MLLIQNTSDCLLEFFIRMLVQNGVDLEFLLTIWQIIFLNLPLLVLFAELVLSPGLATSNLQLDSLDCKNSHQQDVEG